MEAILFSVGLLFFLFWAFSPSKKRFPQSPGIRVSGRGDYSSHLDFLEMHGFISADERQRERELLEEFRKHPERFEDITHKLKGLFHEEKSPAAQGEQGDEE
jgi:hypothetical protein